MSQTVTLSLKLKPTKDQQRILKSMNQLYIQTINELVSEMVSDRTLDFLMVFGYNK